MGDTPDGLLTSLEITRRNPTQIESRQERVEALRSPCPLRQDRRGEANAFVGFRRSTDASFWFLDFDRANPTESFLPVHVRDERHARGRPQAEDRRSKGGMCRI